MKKVVLVHGWDGTPTEGWFSWITNELQNRGFEVCAPQLPDNANPRIYNWVPVLAKAVGAVDGDTYLIGHSMGCQTIARYLETLPDGQKVGGVLFVAGFFKHLTGIDEEGK